MTPRGDRTQLTAYSEHINKESTVDFGSLNTVLHDNFSFFKEYFIKVSVIQSMETRPDTFDTVHHPFKNGGNKQRRLHTINGVTYPKADPSQLMFLKLPTVYSCIYFYKDQS